MNNKVKWNLTELGGKRVRLELGQFSRIPSTEDYKKHIGKLLGIDELENLKKLRDESNPDVAESLLLYNELKRMLYKEVVFSGPIGDVVVNATNFEETFKNLEQNKKLHKEAINDAIQELWTRG